MTDIHHCVSGISRKNVTFIPICSESEPHRILPDSLYESDIRQLTLSDSAKLVQFIRIGATEGILPLLDALSG
jgi:hypothetical protein